MSNHGKAQKCKCQHHRYQHDPNAGKCRLCDCGCFKAIRVRGIRQEKKTEVK
jgi:hypothetical protein